jgi:hypothetical protein
MKNHLINKKYLFKAISLEIELKNHIKVFKSLKHVHKSLKTKIIIMFGGLSPWSKCFKEEFWNQMSWKKLFKKIYQWFMIIIEC